MKLQEFEFIRNNTKNIFFVAHRQKRKESHLRLFLLFTRAESVEAEGTRSVSGSVAEAPPVAETARRGWRSGRNGAPTGVKAVSGTARGLAKQVQVLLPLPQSKRPLISSRVFCYFHLPYTYYTRFHTGLAFEYLTRKKATRAGGLLFLFFLLQLNPHS